MISDASGFNIIIDNSVNSLDPITLSLVIPLGIKHWTLF